MSDNTTERTYCLVESGLFERLLKTYFMQAQSLLLFEHLLGHSDRPMFLSARKVCEALGLDRNKLEQYRRKRIIKCPCCQRTGDVQRLRPDRPYGTSSAP